MTLAGAAHAAFNAMCHKQLSELLAGVLATLIAMMQKIGIRPATPDCQSASNIDPGSGVNVGCRLTIWRRRPDTDLLHHSDQGSQYTCEQFRQLLMAHGIECSMSRTGECHDNAVMESFFSRMKDERVARRRYRDRDEARADIFDYIERFYNPRRRHSSLGGISPMEYERRARLA